MFGSIGRYAHCLGIICFFQQVDERIGIVEGGDLRLYRYAGERGIRFRILAIIVLVL
jgi:hypothetical protein